MGGNRGLGVTFPEQLAIVREAARARYAQLELSILCIPRVTDQVTDTFSSLAEQMQTTTQIVEDMPSALVGSVEAIVDKLEANRSRFDLSYPVISLSAMDAFAPIVRRLAGT
jgi:hypothetical protein